MSNKILIVEDEEDIIELLRFNLINEGFEVHAVDRGDKAVEAMRTFNPDLLLLDIMLPGMNGIDVCRNIKADAALKHTPIIMLSAKGEETDIVLGLEFGAEDYVTKPFSPRVLIARIRSVLRRSTAKPIESTQTITFEGLAIDPRKHLVTINANEVTLTATEFGLLHFLARNPGCVYTRQQIVKGVHGNDYPVTDRSIDVQVTGLRKKLEDYGSYIETVRGVGYRFKE